MTALESDLRNILRDDSRFAFGTVTFCEYGKGGDPGIPDCWIAGKGYWIPCELKRGSSVLLAMRPSQRRWHKDSLLLGIKTYGMSITKDGKNILLYEIGIDVAGGLFETLLNTFSSADISLRSLLLFIMAK